MINVEPANPTNSDVTALLRQSHALMRQLFDEDDCHFLDISALTAPNIRFFAAYRDDVAVGTGAISLMSDYAEIKSMFTHPDARELGVAQAVLSKLIATAETLEMSELKLETGVGLDAAHALYQKNGFKICGPFGDYSASEASIFMRRALSG